MRTTVEMISRWFDEAKAEGASHMLVVTDTYSHDSFPVTVFPEGNAEVEVRTWQAREFHRVEEVYNLSLDKQSQMTPHQKVWNV